MGLLLALLLGGGVPAGAAETYLTAYGYDYMFTFGPTLSTNSEGQVNVFTATNSGGTSYTPGTGAWRAAGSTELTLYLVGTNWFTDDRLTQETHTWGWLAGGLDEGTSVYLQRLLSTWPGASYWNSWTSSPAPPFSVPSVGVAGRQTIGSPAVGQFEEGGSATMKFNTGGPTNSIASRWWRLKLNLSGTDPASILTPPILLPAGGVTLQGQTTDGNGCVWVMLPDNTEVNVTPANVPYSFYYFWVEAVAVELTGIEWWNPATSNWSSDSPIHVLINTTVTFRGQGNVPDVPWPTNALTWTAEGQTYTGGQISHTFNTLSTSVTNPYIVKVAMADKAFTNKVVVFDYEVKFQPAEGPGRFEGRETYPTGFGVGETVDFVAAILPIDVTVDDVGGIDWTVTGMYYDSSYLVDLSETNATSIRLGAFEETDQVTGTLQVGVSAGASRNAQFSAWRPKTAILKDMMVTTLPAGGPLFAWTNIGHNANTISCVKRAAYFLQPQTNSYHGVRVREGAGLYVYSNGTNTYVNNTNITQITFSLTNGAGTVTSGPHTVAFMANPANHTIGGWSYPLHLSVNPGGAMENNYWGIDTFGGGRPTEAGVLPNPANHVPVILTTLSVPIEIEFKFLTDEVYFVSTITSKRDYYSTGRMVIEKKKSGIGSGPHSKEFADGTSIE